VVEKNRTSNLSVESPFRLAKASGGQSVESVLFSSGWGRFNPHLSLGARLLKQSGVEIQMKLTKSFILAGVFVLVAHSTAHAQTGPAPFSDLKAVGAGIVTLGAALGIGMLAKGAFESMARQPEIEDKIRGAMIIVAAFIEGFTFFALAIIILQVLGFGGAK
jgi:F-type H+-transporting ATPase subunit c